MYRLKQRTVRPHPDRERPERFGWHLGWHLSGSNPGDTLPGLCRSGRRPADS